MSNVSDSWSDQKVAELVARLKGTGTLTQWDRDLAAHLIEELWKGKGQPPGQAGKS